MLKIGLGTAAIGRPQYINIKQQSTEEFHKESFIEQGKQVLNSAYEQGIRYYDTAPGYGLAQQQPQVPRGYRYQVCQKSVQVR